MVTIVRQTFQIHYLDEKTFGKNGNEIWSLDSDSQHVVIGPSNGLVPAGNKPLAEPMLTNIYLQCGATR